MAAIHPLSNTLALVEDPPAAPAPVSPVRILLGRYQQVLDRVEQSRGVMWAPLGRRRFTRWLKTPAPRPVVLVMMTVHVRARLRVLDRRNNARIALLKDGEHARRDLETLTHFTASLRRTPSAKIVAPVALAGVLLAACLLAKLMTIVPVAPTLLGDLTKAALKLDPGDMVDALVKSHMDPFSLLCVLTVVLWAMALVTLPLVPAAGAVRHLVAEQPGLREAEAAGFAALRARPPHQFELGLFVEACVAGAALTTGLAIVFIALLVPDSPGWAAAAAWSLGLASLGLTGAHRRLHGRRPNRLQRIARRLLVFETWMFLLGVLAALIG